MPAFTLIEILVVVIIVGLIAAIMIPNLQQQRLKNMLKSACTEMKANIRNVHTYATAVKDGTAITADPFNSAFIAYAIWFDKNASTYTVWEVWENAIGETATFDQTNPQRKQTFSLPTPITLDTIAPTQSPNANNVNLVFKIPSGNLDESRASFDTSHQITLTLKLKTLTQSVKISNKGTVS
jgi:prepilin-type N-terminal cleavage/methylation domain-containing protein